jgi:hypothetical protein
LPQEESTTDSPATGSNPATLIDASTLSEDEKTLLRTSYHDCPNTEANCQCSKYKVDVEGHCGGPGTPGCYFNQDGQENCEGHFDKWLGATSSTGTTPPVATQPVQCGHETVSVMPEL